VKVAFQSKDEGQSVVRTSVPKAAVRQREGKQRVAVNTAGRRRAVTVDGTRGDQSIIAAGLNGGDRIVIEGPDDLADNAAVTEAKK
jgi:hypothetical protein